MILVRDKGAPLTIEEIDANLLEAAQNKVTLTTSQNINGSKTFERCVMDTTELPVGNQCIRAKDVMNAINSSSATGYDITKNIHDKGLYFNFTSNPIINTLPMGHDGIINKEYADNIGKNVIFSSEEPISPDLSPNNTWVVIVNNTISKIFQKSTDTWTQI